ncbi:extracellular solute-binding protein [Akkermansiaceae bacterium]|nr:extracellular solute-binding protein [Akkermansiaceae bacterium]
MSSNWKKYLGVFVPLGIVVAAPLLLRDTDSQISSKSELRLEVITPHNEMIRREFGEAFTRWYQKEKGKDVYVNWRTPGGTSEIKRVLDGAFEAAEERGSEGIGIDLFFGGGEYDFSSQARQKRFQKLTIFETHPEYFGEDQIPQTLGGEKYYDPDLTWVGTCLSSYGICYNTDSLARRGLEPPTKWEDLGDPSYEKGIALADPTKSGSVAKAFEMLIQQQIHQELEKGTAREEAASIGWTKGINLIQRITANAKYFTDSSAKPPRDVAQGNAAAAGMVIDFYGRSFNESLAKEDGSSRLQFTNPEGGSSISVDPVAILKGAPNLELAQDFVRFVLSTEGQMIWNGRPGAGELGPRYRGLRRLPIRRDLYKEPYLGMMTDPDVRPYEMANRFYYDSSLTGHLFTPLRNIIRVMCIDTHEEMKSAWAALIEADFPKEATAAFFDVTPVSYEASATEIRPILKFKDKVKAVQLANRLGKYFRTNYAKAERLAKDYSDE